MDEPLEIAPGVVVLSGTAAKNLSAGGSYLFVAKPNSVARTPLAELMVHQVDGNGIVNLQELYRYVNGQVASFVRMTPVISSRSW